MYGTAWQALSPCNNSPARLFSNGGYQVRGWFAAAWFLFLVMVMVHAMHVGSWLLFVLLLAAVSHPLWPLAHFSAEALA